jgi:L-alanine-DL-glutamate epimerase-like enolase superfamily enzyme
MRIVDIRERSVPVSRYADPSVPGGGLTTSAVVLVTNVTRMGKPVCGYGFASVGRFAQGGLIRERFGPRLLAATSLADEVGTNFDPFAAHRAMMQDEKPGGHGERCIAVGTLDMAVWDAAAKIADLPLYRFLAEKTGRSEAIPAAVPVYAGGGYVYPDNDIARLSDEMRRFLDLGYTRAKLKIGNRPLTRDLARIEAASAILGGPSRLAVDAMNSMTRHRSSGRRLPGTDRSLVVRGHLRSAGFRNPGRNRRDLRPAHRRRGSPVLRPRGSVAASARWYAAS